ncbi:MAG: S9 family peptidase [Bacteroidetes bacterium]|nr:S9 family peptidase [Bacteroidota bacterium]
MCLTFVLFAACSNQQNNKENTRTGMYEKEEIKAPAAEKTPKELIAHGDTRIDDYYWMRLSDEQKKAENPDEHTQKVLDFLNAENEYKEAKLSHTKDLQETIYNEIIGRIKQDDESVPYFKNDYWYYTRYEEGKEYPIYCRKKGSLESDEIILLNVNEMAEGHDYFNVGGFSVSKDNKILAFAEDTLSRRIYTVKFKNLETGEYLTDEIKGSNGGVAWANDNKTVFYTSKNEVTLLSEKILRHKLGQEQAVDALVYKEKDPSYYIGAYKSKSDEYIIIYNSSTLSSDYWILDANQPEGKFKNFSPREKVHEYGIDHFEDKFYIVTNWDAKNFRLMETSDKATEKSNWKEVIPHRTDVLLEGIEIFKNHLVIEERKNGLTELRIRNMITGDEHYLEFDEPAYVAYSSTNPEFDTDLLRFGYSSLTTPNTTYDYNMNTKEKELKKRQEVVGGHNPEEYTTERLYANARDGKKIPISLIYKKGIEKNGKSPLLLYGYGSYGATMDPSFRSSRLSLLDRGFTFAIAHIRGSQTLGREWYDDGKMFNKINTFNDFIDCSKYLLEQNYTNQDKLFAMGGSAGGLLMGAVVNMAPELYKGVVAAVPFVDVVTTMADASIPLTSNEWDEWGNPEIKEQYEYMKSYSPYDNVKKHDYPNMLVTTGLFDSQVQYWEPAKWVAKLREYKTGNNVLLMHTNMEAGHGGASGRFRRYKETAMEYAFFLDLAGMNEIKD